MRLLAAFVLVLLAGCQAPTQDDGGVVDARGTRLSADVQRTYVLDGRCLDGYAGFGERCQVVELFLASPGPDVGVAAGWTATSTSGAKLTPTVTGDSQVRPGRDAAVRLAFTLTSSTGFLQGLSFSASGSFVDVALDGPTAPRLADGPREDGRVVNVTRIDIVWGDCRTGVRDQLQVCARLEVRFDNRGNASLTTTSREWALRDADGQAHRQAHVEGPATVPSGALRELVLSFTLPGKETHPTRLEYGAFGVLYAGGVPPSGAPKEA